MEDTSSSYGFGVCPVCSTSQENLSIHLDSHSKDEIINALILPNQGSNNENLSILQPEENPKNLNNANPQEYIYNSPFENGTTVLGTSMFSAPSVIPYQTSMSTPTPIFAGIKSNPAAVGSNVLPASFSTLPASRTTYLQNGSTSTGISQFTSHTPIPLVYRHPNNTFQIPSNGPVLVQGTHVNLNGFNGLTNQSINSPYPVASPSADHTVSEGTLPPPTNLVIPNSNSTYLESAFTPKLTPEVSNSSSMQTTSLPSCNVSASSQGQQAFLCIFPMSPVQPSVPTGNNYILYGNNVLSASNMIPEVLQQTPVNNSQFSNSAIYYVPSNVPQSGIRQETLPQTILLTQKPEITGNRGQASLNQISSSSQTLIKIDDNCKYGFNDKTAPPTLQNTENKATIEVGDNIKIALPKDIIGKKERLRELINRELVRALLINDFKEEASQDFNSNDRKSLVSLETRKSPNEEEYSETNDSQDKSILSDPEIENHNVGSSIVLCPKSNIQNDGHLPSTSKLPLRNVEIKREVKTELINIGIPESLRRNGLQSGKLQFDALEDNHLHTQNNSLNSLSQKNKAHIKVISSINKQSSSSLGVVPNQFKSEEQITDEIDPDSTLALLSLEKNFSFLGVDTVFSDNSYSEDHVLGAVEDVFTSENSSDYSKSKLPSEKLPVSFSVASNSCLNSESHILNQPQENSVTSVEDGFGTLPKMNHLKYAKTYYRVKKQSHSESITAGGSRDTMVHTKFIDASQIAAKLCSISVPNDEEAVDDPSEELCTHSNITSETFPSKNFFNDESSNEDSKEERTSVYHGVPFKIENGESNSTHTEEMMSLKASETLADSDSERATPSEEITEVFYGKSCIFAGEPGPPNLSSQEFPPIEDSEEHISVDQVEDNEGLMAGSSTQGSSSISKLITKQCVIPEQSTTNSTSEETISLTLDANCSILPADTLHLPHLFSRGNASFSEKNEFFKEELWMQPVTKCLRLQEETKPFVTTGIVMDCGVAAPHASTSGLQSIDVETVKKASLDDEEYDFEYESDYGDSDSETLLAKDPAELERWRCQKCNKTFKSLKEKLLHSGHHSPCSFGKVTPHSDEGDISSMEDPADGQVTEGQKLVSVLVGTSHGSPKDNSALAQSSSEESKSLLCNIKMGRNPVENLKKEKELGVEEDWQLNPPLSTSLGDFKCTECSISFSSVEKLHDHRANAFKSRVICPVCHLVFKNRNGKLRHLKMHHISELKCPICHRNFEGYYSWSQHQLFHMGLILYECKECGHKCQRKGDLEIHYRKHSGERPFKCETCLNSFVSNHSLKRHLVVHMKGQETECDICHKRYKNSIGLSKHKLKIHPKKKKLLKKRTDFMCDRCNEIFRSERKLAWHQETHERWPKKCQQCGECFIHQANLTKHIRFKHNPNYIPEGSQKVSVTCPVCKKTYKRSSLSLHMRTHTGVKPYKCNVCGKEFTVKCNYLAHQWIHTGVRDRPYKCKLCDRSFHRDRFLEAHIRSHKKIRPYTCNECGKSFIHKSNFQNHSRLHTEEKQHSCHVCMKMFFRKYNLKNHLRIHTGETPFECTVCRKVFTQKSNFNVHMKAFHVERQTIHEEV